jgi:hypothetical protein
MISNLEGVSRSFTIAECVQTGQRKPSCSALMLVILSVGSRGLFMATANPPKTRILGLLHTASHLQRRSAIRPLGAACVAEATVQT